MPRQGRTPFAWRKESRRWKTDNVRWRRGEAGRDGERDGGERGYGRKTIHGAGSSSPRLRTPKYGASRMEPQEWNPACGACRVVSVWSGLVRCGEWWVTSVWCAWNLMCLVWLVSLLVSLLVVASDSVWSSQRAAWQLRSPPASQCSQPSASLQHSCY